MNTLATKKQIASFIEIAEIVMTRTPAIEAFRLQVLEIADSEDVDRYALQEAKRMMLDAINEFLALYEREANHLALLGWTDEELQQLNQALRISHYRVLQISLNGTLQRAIESI